MSDEISVSCLGCGIELGMYSPGAIAHCWKCGRSIQVEAPIVGLGKAVLTAAVAVGVGVVVGYTAYRIGKAIQDFLNSA